MRKLHTVLLGSAAGLALIAGPAMAAVTIDITSGTGFVGKGDVQQPLGLNNKQLQGAVDAEKASVGSDTVFVWSYTGSQTYEFDCEWFTGPDRNVKRHQNTKTVERTVSAVVAADPRKTGQWTGWNISIGAISGGAGEPTNADCGAEGNEMKTIVAGSIEAIGSEAAPMLRVQYLPTGQVVDLPQTPIAAV